MCVCVCDRMSGKLRIFVGLLDISCVSFSNGKNNPGNLVIHYNHCISFFVCVCVCVHSEGILSSLMPIIVNHLSLCELHRVYIALSCK